MNHTEQFNLGAGMGPDGLTLPANRTPWERPCLPGNTMQGSVGGVRYDQPDAQHAALLEAGIQSTRTHNVHLQHKVAFLEARMIGQLGHIAKLQMRVKALESELSSLRANVGFGPYPVSASSNGADSVAASPVVAGTIPPPSPASAYAQDHRWSLIGQQHEPAPPNPAAPGVVGNYAEWNLGAKHVDGPGTGSAVYPQTESGAVPVARSPSPTQAPDPAAFDEFQVDAPSSTQAASAETGCAVVPEQAENPSSCNNATPTTVAASAMPRHPLHDFWVDNSHDNSDNPLPSNTRNRDLQGVSVPNGHGAADRANADTVEMVEPVDDSVGPPTRDAEERASIPVAEQAVKAELSPPSETGRGAVPTPVLRCATEGSESAEDWSSHLVDCALCQDPLPEDESIGRCGACPRSFCTQCLEHGLREQRADLEGLDRDGRAMLDGEKGDFFVEQCPHCIRGCDDGFAAPSPGVVPMEHLLTELLRHDLSICFREPVDTTEHPDYVETVGRDAMMDLGTMHDKLKRKRYPRRRGRGQFLEDLNRIWRNCRRYAGCDELGKPSCGTTVPGIVRCALILEAMSTKFCATHMSDNHGTETWQESTWDFHRERLERMNAEARLQQLKTHATTSDNKALVSGVGGQCVNVAAKEECTEVSSCSGSAEGKAPEQAQSSSVQQPATDSSDGGGRKRRPAEMAEPCTESSHAGGHPVAKTMFEVDDATFGGTPKVQRLSVGKTDPQNPSWSPLDKLCDLASTFQK